MKKGKKIFLLFLLTFLISGLGYFAFSLNLKLQKELAQANNLTLNLKRANQDLNNSSKENSEKLNRALADLKAANDRFLAIEKSQISPLKAKLNELNIGAETKDEKLKGINEELKRLQEAHAQSLSDQRALMKKVSQLKAEKSSLSQKLSAASKDIAEENPFIKTIEESIDQLAAVLSEKENQISLLDKELAALNASKLKLGKELAEQQKIIKALGPASEDLKRQISSLSQELLEKNSSFKDHQKEAGRLRQEVLGLQNKISGLEKELFQAHIEEVEQKTAIDLLNMQKEKQDSEVYQKKWQEVKDSMEKIKDLEVQKSSLKSRLNDIQLELVKKIQLIDSMQGNIDFLNQKLAQKEEENKALEAELLHSDALRQSLKEQLAVQQARYQEADSLNNNLKSKFSRLSGVLTDKELELQKSTDRISFLQKETSGLQSRLEGVEKDLAQIRQEQARTNQVTLDEMQRAQLLKERIERELRAAN